MDDNGDDDHVEHGDGHDDDHAHDHGDDEGRITSPMQEFTTQQVGIGVAVLVVGLVLTFGLAFGVVGI